MSGVLAKTIKKKSTDGIFVEVLHTENLGLCMPEQLRLFHLALRNNKFYSGDLETMLYRNIGRYVFSRAKLEDFRIEDDLDSVTAQALRIMRENGVADTKGCGNELGEMLIYTFLEDMLGAPKLMSRVELSTELSHFGSACESIHLFTPGSEQRCQMVFGASNVVGEIKDAIDRSFESILRIEQQEAREIKMVEKTILDRAFDPDEIELIKDLILPSQGKTPSYNTAYGVFLGYSIGLSSKGRTSEEYENLVMQKMAFDIKQHAKYIAEKINANSLGSHSFYFYILPFDDAETEKKAIMENVMEGDVML